MKDGDLPLVRGRDDGFDPRVGGVRRGGRSRLGTGAAQLKTKKARELSLAFFVFARPVPRYLPLSLSK
jgi:hypothetical protein